MLLDFFLLVLFTAHSNGPRKSLFVLESELQCHPVEGNREEEFNVILLWSFKNYHHNLRVKNTQSVQNNIGYVFLVDEFHRENL